MKYLVVIPARGGSKGIPYKNIVKVCGTPLIQYTIDCILQVSFDGDLVVSTEDEKIAAEVRKNKNVKVIPRPIEMATDTAKTEQALLHAIQWMKQEYGCEYDAVVTLQATSPLRTPQMIHKMMMQFEKNVQSYDALLSLSEDRGDFWIQLESGSFQRLDPTAPRRRQDRKPLYLENSAVYITKTTSLVETGSVLGHKPDGYVIDIEEAIDINTPHDLVVVEAYLKRKYNRL